MQKTTYKGIFKIYSVEGIGVPDRLIARIKCDKDFSVLEDHVGLFEDILVDGLMDDLHYKILESLDYSGYFKLISEEQLNQGLIDSMVPELDLNSKPDHEYLMSNGQNAPIRLHIFDNHWVINGKQLTPDEKNKYIELIRSNKISIHPI